MNIFALCLIMCLLHELMRENISNFPINFPYFQEVEDCLGLKPDFYEDFNPMSVFDPMLSSLPPEAPLISLSRQPPPSSDSSSSSSCSSSEYQELPSGDSLASYLYDFSEADNLPEERESEGGPLYQPLPGNKTHKIILEERS